MPKPGRKSEAELEIAAITLPQRPEPPEDLTEEQKKEWRLVVNRLPPDWFQEEQHETLANYCRHVARNRVITKSLDDYVLDPTDPGNIDLYGKLIRAANTESKAVLAYARSMRITHQARYDEKKAHRGASNGAGGKKPWE